jgi:hypothetical protein
VLDEGQSAAVGDELLAEVASFTSADSAVMWAARVLGAKNSLVAADAKLLEDAFEQKFSGFSSPLVTEISADDRAATLAVQEGPQDSHFGNGNQRGDGTDRASSPSRRITPGKVNHRPFALASFFSKLLEARA